MISIVVDTHDFLAWISMEPNWITICLEISLLSDVTMNSSTLLNTPGGYLLYLCSILLCEFKYSFIFYNLLGEVANNAIGNSCIMHLWLHKHSGFGCIS